MFFRAKEETLTKEEESTVNCIKKLLRENLEFCKDRCF